MLSKKLVVFIALVATLTFIVGCAVPASVPATGPTTAPAAGPVTLNIVTAGDTNMEDLQRTLVGPEFIKTNPNVTINVVGTGPGDAGSRAVYTKLKAEKDAGQATWDLDVGIIHQSIMADMIKEGMLEKYVSNTDVAKYVTSADSKNSLGTDVTGYVIPLFHSQVVLAYNPDKVPTPPKNFDELTKWIQDHPNRFGYNGVKGGMSGVAFATGWMYWKSGDYKTLAETGPYDQAKEGKWADYFKQLKALPATMTQGNNGTLDMLNRGEIDMGPVWVDMFVLWKNEGRMDPKIRMALPDPGLPGQPMYITVFSKGKNKDTAIKYAEFLASPKVQADVIVGKYGWYPGIDGNAVLPNVSEQAKQNLFGDVPPDTLAKFGLSFPLGQYLTDVSSVYEAAK